MKVKLIQITQNPIDVMWTAARTCYSEKSPVEMWEDWQKLLDPDNEEVVCDFNEYKNMREKHWNLVKKVLDSGHQSIAEHVYFTFAIEGISRACSHQLVRHRAGIVFSQQSQRYVEIKEDYNDIQSHQVKYNVAEGIEYYKDMKEHYTALKQICDKYFVDVNEDNFRTFANMLVRYLKDIEVGEKPEDARQLLPNATKTNITMSCNFRELIHICNLRLCTRAQTEIRQLFSEIVKCVKEQDERLASYLVPQCEVLGLCTEKECCGRKPHINSIKEDTLTREDWKQIQESINNPQINEKLQKLMEMQNVFD